MIPGSGAPQLWYHYRPVSQTIQTAQWNLPATNGARLHINQQTLTASFTMLASDHGNTFTLLALCEGNPAVTNGAGLHINQQTLTASFTMLASGHGNTFTLVALCEGNPAVTNGARLHINQQTLTASFLGWHQTMEILSHYWPFVRGIQQQPMVQGCT